MGDITEIRYFDVLPGAWVDSVIEEALTKARVEDCVVKFIFNGVDMTVNSYESLAELKGKYQRLLEEGRK